MATDLPGTYFSTGFGLPASWDKAKSRLPLAVPSAQPAGARIGSCPRRQGSQNRSNDKELSPTVTKVPIQPNPTLAAPCLATQMAAIRPRNGHFTLRCLQGRFGAKFGGREPRANGPKANPKLSGPSARDVWVRC